MLDIQQIWQQYVALGGQPNATDFGVWLIQRNPAIAVGASANNQVVLANENIGATSYISMGPHIRAAILLGRLERFVHQLTKPVMKSSGMSEDEFLVLATLLYLDGATKTQLLRQCLIEIPTGSELLKRMKKAGFITESKNPDDGRSAFIHITAEGRHHLGNAFAGLMQVEDAIAVLNEAEKEMLLQLLERLDQHHSQKHDIKQMSSLMK